MEYHFNKESFDKVLAQEKLVIIDFFATWCGPCKMQAPIISEIAQERSDIIVGKVDVDEQQELAQTYGVMSIPTIVLMKKGKVLETVVGYQSKENLLSLIDKYI